MSILDSSELDALNAAALPTSSTKTPARALPFSVGRGDHDITRGLSALDVHVPALRRRFRERLRHQSRQQIEIDDCTPRVRTVDEVLSQHKKGVIAELGGGSGLPSGYIVLDDDAARSLALAALQVRSRDAHVDPMSSRAAITPGELRLLQRLLQVLVEDLGEVLPATAPGQPVRFLRVVTDPRLIAGTGMLLSLQMQLHGDVDAAFELALPASWLVRPKVSAQKKKTPPKRIGDEPQNLILNVSAELGRAPMTLRRLLALEPGDVVHLLASPTRPVPLLVQGAARLQGRPEVKDGRVVVVVDNSADGRPPPKNQRSAVKNATVAPIPG